MQCPDCGARLEAGSSKCEYCGTVLMGQSDAASGQAILKQKIVSSDWIRSKDRLPGRKWLIGAQSDCLLLLGDLEVKLELHLGPITTDTYAGEISTGVYDFGKKEWYKLPAATESRNDYNHWWMLMPKINDSRWINAEQQMPHADPEDSSHFTSVKVLVCTQGKGTFYYEKSVTVAYAYLSANSSWRTLDYAYDIFPTHWMPLPVSPIG
jgi:hypothetical protein